MYCLLFYFFKLLYLMGLKITISGGLLGRALKTKQKNKTDPGDVPYKVLWYLIKFI